MSPNTDKTSPFITLLLVVIITITTAASTTVYAAKTPPPYFLPLFKDPTKLQYYTTLQVGTPPTPVNLVVDLGNLFSWFTCDIIGYNRSSTYKNIHCNTPKCTTYGDSFCSGCSSTPIPTPSCNNDSCGAYAYTPWSNALYAGGLVEDVIRLNYRSGNSLSTASISTFPLTCADKGPLKNLSPKTKGVLTLARTPVALQYQVSSGLKVAKKFALCLPSPTRGEAGAIYFGGGPYVLSGADVSKSLVNVPLVVNPHSTAPIFTEGSPSIEYFFNVNSIEIDGTPVRFSTSLLRFDKDGKGGAKVSTLTPYTTLHTHIYKPFVNLFISKMAALKIVKVSPMAPFGACFSSKSIRYNTRTGAGLPIIDLVMKNGGEKWRIYGSNSMVRMSADVECLAFVDGGLDVVTAVVIGGKQMEDNLVEFDLESNKIGLTSSLLRMGTNCASVRA